MAGVYVSYPFCAQKCTFCNFASGVFSRDLEREYLDALVGEISVRDWPWRPETVYLGGGTPSRLDPAGLERILKAIPGRPWREATLEVAPGNVTRERADAWRSGGVNRVSLGVQSFVQSELARTGRRHTAEVVAQEISVLREAGIENFNVDLIAGLPGQTLRSWRASLEWIERLAPPHVSVYMFETDEDSRLGREVILNGARYGAPEVPGDDLTADLYETAVEQLAGMGIPRYEISNFARGGFESLHNMKYWRLEPYLGFGADAHSFDGLVRFQNVEEPREYVDRIRSRKSPRLKSEPSNPAEERFMIGLRLTRGIRPEPSDWSEFETPIRRFVNDGLLLREGDLLRLSNRGVLLSNEVLAEFIH